MTQNFSCCYIDLTIGEWLLCGKYYLILLEIVKRPKKWNYNVVIFFKTRQCCRPPSPNFILFELYFDVKLPFLRLLLFLIDLKSTINWKYFSDEAKWFLVGCFCKNVPSMKEGDFIPIGKYVTDDGDAAGDVTDITVDPYATHCNSLCVNNP